MIGIRLDCDNSLIFFKIHKFHDSINAALGRFL